MLLDEPTANLDSAGAEAVWEAIERLCRGRTAVVAMHRLGPAMRADRVVVLDGGRVVESGAPAELAEAPGAFRAQLEADPVGALS